MNSPKIENNIKRFEKRISNVIVALLAIAFIITSMLFMIITYQSHIQQKSIKTKDIETAINLFQYNLSEKLSIIASSNIFSDFFNSGRSTRGDLEPRFLTELLPLRSSGIVGYSLFNTESGITYLSGKKSLQSLTLKLCYLSNSLDSENGNCYGSIKLFFSESQIVKQLSRINHSIISCEHCNKYNLTKNGYFGTFLVADKSQLHVSVTTTDEHDNIIYYYIIIIFILFGFALFNRAKLRKIIRETISNPLDLLIQKIKSHEFMPENPQALQEINYLSAQIEEGRVKINKIKEYEKHAAIGYLAAGVAHDIRSPLAVMELTISTILDAVPSPQISILNQAIQSVRDIADNLLEHHRLNDNNENPSNIIIKNNFKTYQKDKSIPRPIILSTVLELIISQKRYEWQKNPCVLELNIHAAAKAAWIYASSNAIERTLSNLLNNAYESLLNDRNIYVSLELLDKNLLLKIRDSGHGIPEEEIKNVLTGSSLKHPGEGFGLSNAKKYLESIHGSLKLTSSLDDGTEVELLFLSHPKPIWFPEIISITKGSIVVVLDDDVSMHDLWRHRFKVLDISTQHFMNSLDLLEWLDSNEKTDIEVIYLVDYELRNDNRDGLNVLTELAVDQHRYLITSHADELFIQEQCKLFGIWLIPKNLIGDVALKVYEKQTGAPKQSGA